MHQPEKKERAQAQKISIANAEEVAQVVDAITGATWNKRNTIMANLFQKDLQENKASVPAYRPPGVEGDSK